MEIDIIIDSHLTPTEFAEIGLLAERSGIRAVWCASYLDGRDPFTNMVELARRSSTIKMGVMAVSPYELHPFRIVLALLTLNEICPGRAEVIIGGGGEVVMSLGVPRDRRVRVVREAVDIVKGGSTARPFSYEGELFQIKDYNPTWITAPPPSVYVAANRPQMLKMSARASDGIWMSDLSVNLAKEAINTVKDRAVELKRDPTNMRFANLMAWYVYDDLAEARHEAKRWIGYRAIFREYMMREFLSKEEFQTILDHIPEIYAMAPANASSVEGVPDSLMDKCVDNLTLTGTIDNLDKIIEHLLEFKAAGVTNITLELKKHQAHGIKLLGERILPALQD